MVIGGIKRAFLRWYPETFVAFAHLGGAAICIWMERWDLLAAGLAFGIPSALLFWDLLPGGRGYIIRLMRLIVR
ncbi:MAG: hypothetical protein ACMUHU_07750 [Thermoplasmatota archaeon]